MLRFLRKRENVKRIMWTLAILVIPAFVLWGSSSAVRSRDIPKYAGKIFGKTISLNQFQAALSACRNQALLIYGDKFNQVAKYLELENEAWERLLLLAEAAKQKIRASDKEVIGLIQNMPLFQAQGQFSQKRYNTLLDYAFHTSARQFEEQMREALKISKLQGEVISRVGLTEEEMEQAYRDENEKAKALYVFFEPQQFKEQIHPADKDLKNYYENHQAEFNQPEQVNVQYLALYFDEAAGSIEVSEEEIKAFYQGHIKEFTSEDKDGQPKIKSEEEARPEIEDRLVRDKAKVALEDKIWDIASEIEANPELFAQAAKNNQLEVKETGFFGPQQLIPEVGLSYEFLNAAFSLKINEVSNVIETPKGYFIIKVKAKKEPAIPPLDEIKEEVESACVQQQAAELAKNKAQEELPKIKKLVEEDKLAFLNAAQDLGLAVKETEEFTRSGYVSGIGQSQQFSQAVFNLKIGQVSEVIAVPNGYCILTPKEFLPIDAEKFAQEKEQFTPKLLARKKELTYKLWLDNLKKQANLENNLGKPNAD